MALALALDIDTIKHAIGAWERRELEAGLAARGLALAMAAEHLAAGHDVIVGHYLALNAFIVDLESVAGRVGADWREIVLQVDAETLVRRLQGRHDAPDRAEHAINNALVRPEDALTLVDSMETLVRRRSTTVGVDARGDVDGTLRKVEDALAAGGEDARSH